MTHSKGFLDISRRIIMAATLSLVMAASPAFAAPSPAFAAQEKTGYVDFRFIQQNLPETKEATVALNNFYRTLVSKNNPAGASKKNSAVKGLTKDQELAIAKKEQELLSPINQKIRTAIESIANKEGFTVVLEKNSAYYVAPENDLTTKVGNQLNIK